MTGLDISDSSIKYVSITNTNRGYILSKSGSVDLPAGVIIEGKIIERAALLEALKQIQQKNHFHYVHACLPEEESFVVRMNLPWVPKKDLVSSLELQLEEYIPLAAENTIFDYEIYQAPSSEDGNYTVSVSAASCALVNDYTSVLTEAGLPPASLEIEVQSSARALIPRHDQGTCLIVDLGKTRTGFAIVSHGMVMFSSTIKSIGGDKMTAAVAESLKVSLPEAEKLKAQKGLLPHEDNKPVFEALLPIASLFKDEINRHYNYWDHLRETGEVAAPLSRVILCGGQSSMPGFTDYIAADLPIPVGLGDPWAAWKEISANKTSLELTQALRFCSAIGLALRGVQSLL